MPEIRIDRIIRLSKPSIVIPLITPIEMTEATTEEMKRVTSEIKGNIGILVASNKLEYSSICAEKKICVA